MEEALTLAWELAHPFSLAMALYFAAWCHQLRREGQLTHAQAEAAITLSTDQGFTFFSANGAMLRGWALAEQGQEEEGITQLRQGLAGLRATGAEAITPYFLALLTETYGKGGQAGGGLIAVGEALAIAEKNEERFYEAELYRLKGELVLQSTVHGPQSEIPTPQHPTRSTQAEAEAEECFLQAIAIARQQQAKSLELRAVMSLSRLWQQQGKKAEARELLSPVYNWFTEGFDTKDLQEAKALLEELH